MSEGMLFFVRLDDPREVKLETCGRPICPTTRCACATTTVARSPGEVGELTCRGPYTLRGYYGVPEYNARQFTSDGFYRSGDLMRGTFRHYVVEGRKKDLINAAARRSAPRRSRNLICSTRRCRTCLRAGSDPNLGEKMCACVSCGRGTCPSRADRILPGAGRSPSSRFRAAGNFETSRCPRSQGVAEGAYRRVTRRCNR